MIIATSDNSPLMISDTAGTCARKRNFKEFWRPEGDQSGCGIFVTQADNSAIWTFGVEIIRL